MSNPLIKRICLCCLLIGTQMVWGQQSKNLRFLVDSIPVNKSVRLKLPVDSGFMAVERIAIAPDGTTIYYGTRNGYDSTAIAKILKISFENQRWNQPTTVFHPQSGAPSLSKDGNTMYFQYDDAIKPKGVYSSKKAANWKTPKPFQEGLAMSHYLQSPSNNRYYYAALTGENKINRDIYKVSVKGKDTLTTSLGFDIKGEKCCTDLFVANDESYLIIALYKKDNNHLYQFYGELDLFISFQNNNGFWSKPQNLGKSINGVSEWTWGPFVTNDHKYLLFSSWTTNVGVRLIEFKKKLKPLRKQAVW